MSCIFSTAWKKRVSYFRNSVVACEKSLVLGAQLGNNLENSIQLSDREALRFRRLSEGSIAEESLAM